MIRPYQKNDKKEMLSILMANTPAYFHVNERKDFARYLDDHEDFYLVFEENRQIMGGAGWHLNKSSGSISWVLCHPETHGKGIGSRLVVACIERLQQEKTLNSMVVRTSQMAYLFFEKFGFEVVRTQDNYWGPGYHLYYMEMEIC